MLALVGRDEEKFASVMEKIQDCGVEMEPLMILADVCIDAERIISETIEKYGRLDILINIAGYVMHTNIHILWRNRNSDTLIPLAMAVWVQSRPQRWNNSMVCGRQTSELCSN